MSPVSPVFHTAVKVRIGLKTQLDWRHPFHIILCLCWSADHSTYPIFSGVVNTLPRYLPYNSSLRSSYSKDPRVSPKSRDLNFLTDLKPDYA